MGYNMGLKQDNGFTLIEVMLVLSLVSLLVTIPVLNFTRMKEETETQLFFESLRSGITLIQNEAIVNDHWTLMEVRPRNRLIRFRVTGANNGAHPANHILYLPDSVSLVGTATEYSFSRGSGNLGNFIGIGFNTIHGRVNVSFQIGSGRFVIQ